MKSRNNILSYIKNIINDNHISIYNIANIASINRSTLQKALSGDRNLNLRQFHSLVNVLPIPVSEKKQLFSEYLNDYWDFEKIARVKTIFNLLQTISNGIESKTKNITTPPLKTRISNFKNLNIAVGEQSVIDIIKDVTISYMQNNDKFDICVYIPWESNFFYKAVDCCLYNNSDKTSVSVLFEFLKPSDVKSKDNINVLKYILPLLLSGDDIYSYHYVYIDSYFYDNHLTPYPYYIIFPDIALLLNSELNALIPITDKNVIEDMHNIHMQKVVDANTLNVNRLSLYDAVTHLMSTQVSSNMCSIAYEPCLTSFATYDMYADLINENFAYKKAFLTLIESRLNEISEVEKKYYLFNAQSIKDFAKTGNLLMYKHPFLNMCSIQQRIDVLTNVLNQMKEPAIIMRAYDGQNLNIPKNFEITNTQDSYNFDIIVYLETNDIKLIDIHEPIISSYFVNFVRDILDTPLVYSFEETKQLIESTIEELKCKL